MRHVWKKHLYEHDRWPSHKAEMSLGQAPVLEFDVPKLLNQCQLASRDNFEQAKCDAFIEKLLIHRQNLYQYIPNKMKQKKSLMKNYQNIHKTLKF
jgi:hypothetical protein